MYSACDQVHVKARTKLLSKCIVNLIYVSVDKISYQLLTNIASLVDKEIALNMLTFICITNMYFTVTKVMKRLSEIMI